MRDFQILTDSVSDLPASWLKEHPYVTIIDTPITVTTNDRQLTLRNLTADNFDQIAYFVEQGGSAITSQPSVFDPEEENPFSVESVTKDYLRRGKDVIYVDVKTVGDKKQLFFTGKMLSELTDEERASGDIQNFLRAEPASEAASESAEGAQPAADEPKADETAPAAEEPKAESDGSAEPDQPPAE